MLWIVLTYLACGLALLYIAWQLGLDHDPGGYPDRVTTIDKAQHLAIAFLLTWIVGFLSGLPYATACVTVALSVGWELVQRYPADETPGYFSWLDVLADALGAAAAVAILVAR